jgi:prepilin-type N-terminal cleavage/methylation domain-containing protein
MLNTHRLYRRASRLLKRSGFTLVELLVVIAIIAILAGVALGPITAGIKKAQQSGALSGTKALALAEFQYANDNNNIYPYGNSLNNLVTSMIPNYISDYGTLIINGSGNSKVTSNGGTIQSSTTPSTATCSYDFTVAGATAASGSGLTASTPDGFPVVFSGATAPLANTASGAGPVTINIDSTCPLGISALAVCYKSNSAKLIQYTGTATPAAIQIIDPSWAGTFAGASFGSW